MAVSIHQNVTLLKLLADRTRFRILELLISKEDTCVKDIASEINMSHSATSHQLAKLEERGIVSCERRGQTMCYSLNKNASTGRIKSLMKALS